MPKRREWTENDIKNIIKLYTEDEFSISYIATQILHCRANSISKILKDNNIEIRSKKSPRILNKKDEEEIIKLYTTTDLFQNEIARKYNCCTETIHKVLVKNNIKIINKPKLNKEQNDEFFDNIDTEEKAYFLGFVFADGNVYNHQLTIEIQAKDRELLERFKKELNLNSKISYRNRGNTEVCSIRMISEHLCNSLAKYGIVPDKTHKTKHLPELSLAVRPHFIRGLIDGDGWISIDKNNYYHIGFVSNYQSTCEDFKTFCNSFLPIEASFTNKINVKDKKNNGYVCQTTKQKTAKCLANILYKDCKICLSRKYRLVEPLFDSKNDEDIV